MSFQYSTRVRNACADVIETTIGASAVLKIRTGAVPANVAAADSGTVLGTLILPADWLTNASAGAKSILGVWQDAGADAGGTAGHFRLYASDGVTCDIQGTVTLTGGGGDMTLDNTNITAGQQITVTSFTVGVGGA